MPKGSLSFREQPRRASCSCGMSCPVCLALDGFPVLSCPVSVSSPGGLLIPPNFPREIFWGGGKRVPAVGAGLRGRGHSHKDHLLWPPELPALTWPPELPAPPWPPELPAPVVLSVSVLRGLQSAHPPSPVELLRRGTRLPGGGSYVRVLSWVSCVPASCVHIWFVSCLCLMSVLVNSVPGVCM